MPIIVTEDPLKRRMSNAPPWTAYKEFHISGPADERGALDESPYQINDHWSASTPSLKCVGPVIVEAKSPDGYWVIGCSFSQPPFGRFIDDPTADPLSRRPKVVVFRPFEISVPVDVDLDGRKIVNGAGDPFDPGTREIQAWELQILRNEPFFDLAKAQTFSHTDNSDTGLAIYGYPVPQYHCKCVTIYPAATDYDDTAEYLPIIYVFHILFRQSVLGPRPWQDNRLNMGTQGWWDDGGTKRLAKFSDGKGNTIDRPIPLDLTGKPYSSAYSFVKVGEHNAAPAANPEATGSGTAAAIPLLTSDALTGAIRITYRKVYSTSHAALNL
jgi:hypothetical protein